MTVSAAVTKSINARALAEATEIETQVLWCLQNDELVVLVMYLVTITAKQLRKQRANNNIPGEVSLRNERTYRIEPHWMLVPDGFAAHQWLAAVQQAVEEFFEVQRHTIQRCALALNREKSGCRRSDYSV
jgi:hypothetical protein